MLKLCSSKLKYVCIKFNQIVQNSWKNLIYVADNFTKLLTFFDDKGQNHRNDNAQTFKGCKDHPNAKEWPNPFPDTENQKDLNWQSNGNYH